MPHILRFALQLVLGIPESKIRVIAPDVGGGFGSKLDVYARGGARGRARAPARPSGQVDGGASGELRRRRSTAATSSTSSTLAATKDGTITAVKSEAKCAMGAYLQLVTPGIPLLGAWIYSGPYDDPELQRHVHGRLHEHDADRRVPRCRPAGGDLRARAHDGRARARARTWIRVELRRKNFITEFPHTMASGLTIDSGDYARVARPAPRASSTSTRIRAEQAARRERGDAKQIGVGFSTYNEMCGLAPSRILGAIRYAVGGWDAATIRFLPLGSVQVVTGHVAARPGPRDDLGADRRRPARRRRRRRRGAARRHGGLPARHGHVRQPLARGRRRRALPREREGDREGAGDRRPPARGLRGRPRVRGRHLHGQGLARQDDDDPGGGVRRRSRRTTSRTGWSRGSRRRRSYDPPNFSWPGGAHAAVVEVDTETGDARLVRYVAVDDVGNPVNPQIVDGQVHGGITQGIAAALYEEARTTRTATCSRRRWRPTSCRRRRSCRRTRSTEPRPRPTTRSA